MTTPGVDFFRVDRSGTTRRLLITGFVLVTLGASSVGAHLIRRLPVSASHAIGLAGSVLMLGGLALAFGALAMMLFENVYIAIRDEGLLIHDNGNETTIPWDELAGVGVDRAMGVVELRRADKEPLRRHAGRAATDVAARIGEAKRKAAHGLLRTGSKPPAA